MRITNVLALCVAVGLNEMTIAQTSFTSAMTPDIPRSFVATNIGFDYTEREVMIPMRDGVQLHTVIVVPKGEKHLPIILVRTPYGASEAVRNTSPYLRGAVPEMVDVFAQHHDYIFVVQDVRGKFGSQGIFVMTRPPVGPLNHTGIDETTDAWDTIEWLSKDVPESNGKVGMIGGSYLGWEVAMALLHPNPALKVTAVECPIGDGWMGDDWFHYGAFRQTMMDFFISETSGKGFGQGVPRQNLDDYTNFLQIGTSGAWAHYAGMEQLPWWRKVEEHPTYDNFWREQALDRLLKGRTLEVPVMWVQGLWDEEDMWGAIHAYGALEVTNGNSGVNLLVIGPWSHYQMNSDGRSLGPLQFDGDTSFQYRAEMLKPFFDRYLKDGAAKGTTPPVVAYLTGLNRWERLQRWPIACEHGCSYGLTPIYLQPKGGLSFEKPAKVGFDQYISDPAKPVPYLPRPIAFSDWRAWGSWLVHDQRFVDGRPDVLTYKGAVLTQPIQVSGPVLVDLYAATSGTDADWVVKVIDVYPGQMYSQSDLGGYELPIAMDIFRGRYRKSFEKPTLIPSGKRLLYRFALPNVNHVFLPGHQIMVQVQSSWFPLYDLNPQKFVPSIFMAKPSDYHKETEQVFYGGDSASAVELPVVPLSFEVRAPEFFGRSDAHVGHSDLRHDEADRASKVEPECLRRIARVQASCASYPRDQLSGLPR